MLVLTETSQFSLQRAAQCLMPHQSLFSWAIYDQRELPRGCNVFADRLLPLDVIDIHRALDINPELLNSTLASFLSGPAVPELVIIAELVSPSEREALKKLLQQVNNEAVADERSSEDDKRIRASWYCSAENRCVRELIAPFGNIQLKQYEHPLPTLSTQQEQRIMNKLCLHAYEKSSDDGILRQLVADLAASYTVCQEEPS